MNHDAVYLRHILDADVPWRKICGLRDVLIHHYMGVDLAAVWKATQSDLPQSRRRVESILASIDGS